VRSFPFFLYLGGPVICYRTRWLYDKPWLLWFVLLLLALTHDSYVDVVGEDGGRAGSPRKILYISAGRVGVHRLIGRLGVYKVLSDFCLASAV